MSECNIRLKFSLGDDVAEVSWLCGLRSARCSKHDDLTVEGGDGCVFVGVCLNEAIGMPMVGIYEMPNFNSQGSELCAGYFASRFIFPEPKSQEALW